MSSVMEPHNCTAKSPMIHRGYRRIKMGSIISKRKDKKEGLMSQMKNMTERSKSRTVSPSPSTIHTPPPRNLATTLASPTLSHEFLSFLRTLDEASCLEEGECGRADSLQFVLDLRDFEDREDDGSSHSFGCYFPATGGGLVLDNRVLWEECQLVVSLPKLSQEGRKRLGLAAECCCSELENLHILFLSQRKEPSAVCQMMSCIL